MKLLFMGTPDFAREQLTAIVEAGYEVAAVVTQPDRQKGRGKELQMPSVKEYALSKSIPVFQPEKVKDKGAVETLRGFGADLFVVAAFGQLLSEEILQMPPLGCINIHASLLPKYRGASPIQWAIINGDEKTGITIQQMAKTLDTGDMLFKKEVLIDKKETGQSLHDKLSAAGAALLVEALPLIEQGILSPEKQVDAEATYVSVLKKELGYIDFSGKAAEIERLIRGLNSWPSAYTYLNGKVLKLWEADVCQGERAYECGHIEKVDKDGIYIGTGSGLLKVTSLQLEGKKRLGVAEFLRGCPLEKGTKLGK